MCLDHLVLGHDSLNRSLPALGTLAAIRGSPATAPGTRGRLRHAARLCASPVLAARLDARRRSCAACRSARSTSPAMRRLEPPTTCAIRSCSRLGRSASRLTSSAASTRLPSTAPLHGQDALTCGRTRCIALASATGSSPSRGPAGRPDQVGDEIVVAQPRRPRAASGCSWRRGTRRPRRAAARAAPSISATRQAAVVGQHRQLRPAELIGQLVYLSAASAPDSALSYLLSNRTPTAGVQSAHGPGEPKTVRARAAAIRA